MNALSSMTEAAVFGRRFTLISSDNARLVLEDDQGRRRDYVDLMSAYGSVNFGHNNPQIRPFVDAPADIAACIYPREAELFASWLCRSIGATDHEVLFQVGGSFAVSTALSLAVRHRPGRIVAVDGAFHGLGVDALAVTTTHRAFALQDSGWVEAVGRSVTHVSPGDRTVDWSGVSCLIFEPIQGANGYVPLEVEWLSGLVADARAAGVVIIADEIQCGYYRHGHLSVSASLDLDPDISLFSKSMTNGSFPLSAVVLRRALAGERGALALAHTFQTSALGCYAAWATARYIDRTDVRGLVARVSGRLEAVADEIARLPVVRRVHVTGPTLSFEVEGGARPLVQACLDRGVMPFTGGPRGERIRLAPPLTIPDADLDQSLDVLVACLRA